MLRHDETSFSNTFETFANHVHPEDIGRLHGAISGHLQQKQNFDLEFRMRTGDGMWQWVRARGCATFEGGEAVRMMGMMNEWPLGAARDLLLMSTSDRLAAALEEQARVTRELEDARADLLRQNEELRGARAQTESAMETKSLFLANMSHEIRTPMTSILGFIDVLLDEGAGDDERKRLRRSIRRNSEHLLAIINDVLDISKIDAGGMSVEKVPTHPLRVIQEAMASMQPQATERSLDLRLVLAGSVPQTIQSDPHRLRQILLNLIGNAVKFTDHGGIQVSVRMVKGKGTTRRDEDPTDPAPQTTRLQCSVTDTGIGLDAEQRTKLFRPFSQADASTTRRFGGTGLGLTISRRLARLLGGDLYEESAPGIGSTFVVEVGVGDLAGVDMVHELPADLVEETTPQSQFTDTQEKTLTISVLLAEDGDDNRRLITHHLRRAGMVVTVANNGREAVELALAARKSGHPHDVILMDMQMPVVDGYQATQQLRAAGWTGQIAALTAHAMHGDQERCLRSGCNCYLTKPLERDPLLKMVRDMAAKSREIHT